MFQRILESFSITFDSSIAVVSIASTEVSPAFCPAFFCMQGESDPEAYIVYGNSSEYIYGRLIIFVNGFKVLKVLVDSL